MFPTLFRTAASVAALSLAATPALAAIYNVTTPTELAVAAKAVVAGDTILIAPGEYGDLRLFRRKITGGRVHITSADQKNPARIGKINLEGATGFLFTHLDISAAVTPIIGITSNAADISFHANAIHGATPDRDPWNDNNTAVYIRGGTRISFTENEFHDLKTALYVQNSFDVIIAQNRFAWLREGLNFASVGRADIVGNHFHDIHPRFDLGEHPDAIQFWTARETWGSYDVTLRNNFFALGGQRMVHGIFARSEEAEKTNGLPIYFERFKVTGNVYYGSALHGITLSSMHNAEVSNNVIVASPTADLNDSKYKSPDGRLSGGLQPQLRLANAVNVKAWNNVAMNGDPSNFENVTSWNHVKIFDPVRRTGEPWTSVFAARPTADAPPLSAFLSMPGTAAYAQGIGLIATFPVGPTVTQAPSASKLDRNAPAILIGQLPGGI